MKAEDVKDITAMEEDLEDLYPAQNSNVEEMRSVIESYRKKHPEIEIFLDGSSKIKV